MLVAPIRAVARVTIAGRSSRSLNVTQDSRLYQKRASELRVGDIIEHKNKLWSVARADHTKTAQRRATMQCELREVNGAGKSLDRFNVDEEIECPEVENKKTTYMGPMEGKKDVLLFKETNEYVDNEDFLTYEVPANLFPSHFTAYFKPERTIVHLKFIDDKPVSYMLKTKAFVGKIASLDTTGAARTSSSGKSAVSWAPAILENGRKVSVPANCQVGQSILVTHFEEFIRRHNGDEEDDEEESE